MTTFNQNPIRLRKQIGASKPSWETYNNRYNQEYQLAESIVTEFTDISGIKCLYYQRDNVTTQPDVLYGETQDITYKEGKPTKILYEVGEIQTLYSMFGMMATDQIIAHIPQTVYVRDISQTELPKPGDVIKVEWYASDFTNDYDDLGRSFEIVHVAQDQAIFQLRSLVYVLYLKPYRFSEESDMAREVASDLQTDKPSISDFGDNDWIDEKSQEIAAYDNIDTKIYGYGE